MAQGINTLGASTSNTHDPLSVYEYNPTEDKPFKCRVCGRAFRFKSKFYEHAVSHNEKKPFKCEKCGKLFKQKKALSSHRIVHIDEKPFTCEKCGKLFKRKQELRSHRIVHIDETPFKCERCHKTFKDELRLIRHVKDHHDANRTQKCGICGKEFRLVSDLNKHAASHNQDRPYTCTVCNTAFKHKENLNAHTLIVHENKRVECTTCMKTFTSKQNLLVHALSHNNRVSPDETKALINHTSYDTTSICQVNLDVNSLVCDENQHLECSVCKKHFQRPLNSTQRPIHSSNVISICSACETLSIPENSPEFHFAPAQVGFGETINYIANSESFSWSSSTDTLPTYSNVAGSVLRSEFSGDSIQPYQEFQPSELPETNSLHFERDTRTRGRPFTEASPTQDNLGNSTLHPRIGISGEISNLFSNWLSFLNVDNFTEIEL